MNTNKKALTFQSGLLYRIYPLSSSGGFSLATSTHCLANSFVCNFLSSSAGFNLCRCFIRFTLVFCFRSTFSGPSIPQLFAASFPLSDLRCFGILSSASVLDSDYSASVLPFLLFPVPPHSCFPGARIRSRFLGFLFLSGLISHAFLPDSCTQLRCSFLFALPCFAPTAVPQVLTFCSAFSRPLPFRYFPLPSRFLSSACLPLPATQPSVLPFLFFPVPPYSCFPGAPSPLSLPRFPLSLRPDFSCLPSRFLYSALLLVSFRPSLIRSRSCSSGAYLMLSLSGFPLAFAFFRPLVLGSDYSAFRLSFPFFPFSPVGGSSGAAPQPCGLPAFPLPSGLLPCLPSDCGTQLTALPFSLAVSPHSGYLSASAFPCGFGLVPFAFASGSGYLASGFCLAASSCLPCLSATLDILPQVSSNVNNFFKIFLYIFTICEKCNIKLYFCYVA